MVDLEELLRGIGQEYDVLSGKGSLDVIGLLVDINAAIGTDAAREGLPMNALEPAIRIDRSLMIILEKKKYQNKMENMFVCSATMGSKLGGLDDGK